MLQEKREIQWGYILTWAIITIGVMYTMNWASQLDERIQALEQELEIPRELYELSQEPLNDLSSGNGSVPFTLDEHSEIQPPSTSEDNFMEKDDLYDIPQFTPNEEEELFYSPSWEDLGMLSVEDMLEFSSDEEARQAFLEENINGHFWLPREWERGTQYELYLPLVLEAGFENVIISSGCPLRHIRYAEHHIQELGDEDVAVSVVDETVIETYTVDMTVLEDGVILLEYSLWMCHYDDFFPMEELSEAALST